MVEQKHGNKQQARWQEEEAESSFLEARVQEEKERGRETDRKRGTERDRGTDRDRENWKQYVSKFSKPTSNDILLPVKPHTS